MKKFKFLIMLFLICRLNIVEAAIINISNAIAFQNEGTTNVDHTSLLSNVDGFLGPVTEGTVTVDYYATGFSSLIFDALSLNFDLSSIGYTNITGASIRFYTQKGAFGLTSWQHYQVLDGAFNSTNEDELAGAVGSIDFGDGSILSSDTTVGWIDKSLDLSWITSNNFDVTLRLWNARIDRVELQVDTSSVPTPTTAWLLGSSLIGLIGMKKKRVKASIPPA